MALPRLPPTRYLVLAVTTVLLVLHFALSHSSPTYSTSISLASLRSSLGMGADSMPSTWYRGTRKKLGYVPPASAEAALDASEGEDASELRGGRANATFVVLARNTDLWDLLGSVRSMEDRFNKRYHYPYVFLNDEPFSDEFKLHTSSLCSGPTTYGLIPSEQWSDVPSWLSMEKINTGIAEMATKPIPYGWSLPYRKMCRYQSGFFWRHPLLDPYKYYWRVEPNVKYFCDLDYDPFMVMQTGNKSYGFVVTIKEYAETVVTLWNTTKEFIKINPQFVPKNNLMNWLSQDNGESYNLCHFWSNFEIGNLDFWRGEAYSKYFDFLDQAGGFFYERWGDAPVHSIAAALFLEPKDFHFFSDIGYRHEPFQHCPQNSVGRCSCNPGDSFESHWYSCTPAWKKLAMWGEQH